MTDVNEKTDNTYEDDVTPSVSLRPTDDKVEIGCVRVVTSSKRSVEQEHADKRKKIAYRVSIVSIVLNLVLTAFKLFAGIFARSMAMISDAVHSASDVFSTFVVMIGIKLASKKSDEKHQYGHERLECVAAIILAVLLAGTGVGLGYGGVSTLIKGNYSAIPAPGLLALIAAAVSILVKEGMFWYTRAAAKKINSGALKADAWHHQSDALSSIGALFGILGARLGIPVFDPIASILICVFIIKAAIEIFSDAVRKMTDEACDRDTVDRLRAIITSEDGVDDLDKLLTRKFGDRIYVEAEISVRGDISLREAHEVAKRVHNSIERGCPEVKHCSVHVNPTDHDVDEAEQ